jgi:hypothetical protein
MSPEELKTAIVTLLKLDQQIGMNGDLCCYASNDGFFQVDYLYSEETLPLLNLTDREKKTIQEDEELVEVCETAEEAADFYLRLTGGIMFVAPNTIKSKKKRTLHNKVAAFDKDMYF